MKKLFAYALISLTAVHLAGCAPSPTNSTVSSGHVGTAGRVSYGTIIGMRPVSIAGSSSGIGAGAGAIGGGLIGSTIGKGSAANIVGGVAGALIGGVAGHTIENAATSGQAMEFLIRDDRGSDMAVVQTNEMGFQVGERVAISWTDRARISRAGHVPPPGNAYRYR